LFNSGGGSGRRTVHISHRTTQNIYRAIDYATHIGRPLNRYVVIRIHGDSSGGGAAAPLMLRKLARKFCNWLRRLKQTGREDCPPIYTGIIENPPGKTAHVNWMVHVPHGREKEFEKKLAMWARRILGNVNAGDIDAQPIDANTVKRLAKYVTKGTNPAYARHFYLEDIIADQGEVIGKRAGASVAIGNAARKRADFRPPARAHMYAPRRSTKAPKSKPAPPRVITT